MNEPKSSFVRPPLTSEQTKTESEFQKLLNQPHKGTCEYVPYGAQDKIKLTVPIIQNLIAVKTKSGKTCSERDAIKFLAMCQAKRMNPFEGDCFLIGYDNRDGSASFALVTAHQTYLKRAELHPEFDGMRSGIIVRENGALVDLEGDFHIGDQEVVGGWATIYFKNRKQVMHKRLRLSRFQKPFGVWQEDPAGMICKCAEADALRSSFPTMLGGLYLREELEVEPKESKFSKPLFTEAAPSAVIESPAPEPEPESASPTPLGTSGAPQPAQQSHPQAPSEAPKPVSEPAKGNGFNPLKAVTGLCDANGIKYGEIMGWLAQKGATDGSLATLEEVPKLILKAVCDRWAEVQGDILAARKGELL